MRIRLPVFLRVFLPLAGLILIGSLTLIDRHRSNRLNVLQADEVNSVNLGAEMLDRRTQIVRRALDYLVHHHPLQLASGMPDLTHMEQDFIDFMAADPVFDQVRWINAQGKEVVRVDLVNGKPKPAAPADLQNKADRPYFTETMRLPAGEIYVSEMDLNIKRGVIEVPHKPVIRMAMVQADRFGKKRGMVVLNYVAEEALAYTQATVGRAGGRLMVANRQGYFLKAPDPADEWGFMFNDQQRSLGYRFPEAWARISSAEQGQFLDAYGLWTFRTVFPRRHDSRNLQVIRAGDTTKLSDEEKSDQWKVLIRLTPEQLDEMASNEDASHYPLITLLLLLCAAGSLLVARVITREHEVEQRFRAYFEHTTLGMGISAPNKKWLAANPALCRILGYSAAQLYEKTWVELTHPDDLQGNLEKFQEVQNGEIDGYSFEKRFVRSDGSVVETRIAVQVVRKNNAQIEYFLLVVEDISQQALAQREREQTLETLRRFIDHLPGAAYIKDQNARIVLANQHFLNVLGGTSENIVGRLTEDFFPGEEGGGFAANDRRVMAGGLPERFEEIVGEQIYETIKFPILHKNGMVELGGISLDVTARKKTEGMLALASAVVNASPVVCFRWAAVSGWPVRFVSDNVIQWGYSAAELVAGNPPFADLVHPDDLARVVAEVAERTAAGAIKYEQEYRIVTRNNQVVWVADRTTVQRDGSGNVEFYDGVLTDITERKEQQLLLATMLSEQQALNRQLTQMHNQLLQSEKMSSIGQLAAGIAHELNNPIGFVHSNLGTLDGYVRDLLAIIDAYEALVKTEVEPCPALAQIRLMYETLDFNYLRQDIVQLMLESKDGLARVREIVLDLKSFSHVSEQEWQWADLHQGLNSTLNIVKNELKYKCTVVKAYGELPQVFCMISQLNQVFMNLLVNAGHAIEQQGTITIRTLCLPDDKVCVEISDTGKGISPEYMRRIFEPFFTTKPVGKGTGLGLALAYGIVDRHHGRIEVESTVDVGTTFRVIIPINQDAGVQGEPPETNA